VSTSCVALSSESKSSPLVSMSTTNFAGVDIMFIIN
jgi:hypothetical protein